MARMAVNILNIFVTDLTLIDNLLDSAHFAGFKAHLDAVRVMGGTGQYLLHDSPRPFSAALILFLDDVDLKPWFYVFSVLAVHTSPLFPKCRTDFGPPSIGTD
jgi:hypothetical protein